MPVLAYAEFKIGTGAAFGCGRWFCVLNSVTGTDSDVAVALPQAFRLDGHISAQGRSMGSVGQG